LAVNVTNNQPGSITITRGNVWLQFVQGPTSKGTVAPSVTLALGGPMIGTFQSGVFTPAGSATTIPSAGTVVLVYKIIYWSWIGAGPPSWLSALPSGVTFSGMATMTNDNEGSVGSNAYFSGTSSLDGLYVKSSC
jgi:hypothetical protein